MKNTIEKISVFIFVRLIWPFNMEKATKILANFYKKYGMKIDGEPRYISAKVWFDGTDYSLITLGKRVTISSNIRILTHDWSIDTVHESFIMCDDKYRPIGTTNGVYIGDYSFIGTGSIIMPGAHIGKSVIIGAGSVVRGTIPDYSIVIGNPCKIIGNTKKYCRKKMSDKNINFKELTLGES